MRKRNIQKIVRLSRDEAQDLQKKAKKACRKSKYARLCRRNAA